MDSIGEFGQTTGATDSDDHQRRPGAHIGKIRGMNSYRVSPESRARALVTAIGRLEQEHVALLMALCDLEESSIKHQDALVRATLRVLLLDDLRRTQHALGLAAQGTYGSCEICQQPLSRRHLALFPAVTRCSACAGRAPLGH